MPIDTPLLSPQLPASFRNTLRDNRFVLAAIRDS